MRTLPAPPDYLRPVPVPAIAEGQDARAALARNISALGRANTRLRDTRTWYGCVRASYGDQKRHCARSQGRAGQ